MRRSANLLGASSCQRWLLNECSQDTCSALRTLDGSPSSSHKKTRTRLTNNNMLTCLCHYWLFRRVFLCTSFDCLGPFVVELQSSQFNPHHLIKKCALLFSVQGSPLWQSSARNFSVGWCIASHATRENPKGHRSQYSGTTRVTECFEIPLILSWTCVAVKLVFSCCLQQP